MISNLQIENRIKASPARPKLVEVTAHPEVEQRLLNRELSLVEFFRHVLQEGLDDQNPLLERLRFLTIFSNIVDEFFMIRVSGLKEGVEDGWVHPSPDGLTAADQLREIRHRLRPMIAEQMRCLNQEILPELAQQEIVITSYALLSPEERGKADDYFKRNVFPVLTPLGVDPAHPFPYISGLSLNLGLMVESPDADRFSRAGSEARFVRLKVPPVLPGLVAVSGVESKFTFLNEISAANLGSLFPGMRFGESYTFRVTRDADIDVREDEADDLLR